ncbi:MAG: hypothetical protein ACLFSV_03020 [Alkalispirochaeta sp.]
MTKNVPSRSSLNRTGSVDRRFTPFRIVVHMVVSVAVATVVSITGCASVAPAGDPPPERASDGGGQEAPARRYFSPWPASVTPSFRETAYVATDWIGFSHPEGWRFATTAPAEIAIILPDDDVTGRIALLPRDGTSAGATGTLPASTARFLQWADALPGEIVWSDETIGGSRDNPREIFIAISATKDEQVTGLIWQEAADREVVIEYTGSRGAVESATRGMIRTAKTVAIPEAESGSTGDRPAPSPEANGEDRLSRRTGAGRRRLETGLTFAAPAGTEIARWRWQEDLATGFVLSLAGDVADEAAPGTPGVNDGTGEPDTPVDATETPDVDDPATTAAPYRVAVWQDEGGTFSFDLLSETEPPDGELRALLTEYLSYREVEGGVR